MFERLAERARRLSARRAERRRAELAARLNGRVAGVEAALEGETVVLSGRGLKRRAARDPAVRWLVREAIDGEG
jgi:hypothetical protein